MILDTVYRFQVHYRNEKIQVRRYIKFVADIRPAIHRQLDLKIAALIAIRSEQPRRFMLSQREIFDEIWTGWDLQNKSLASKLPAKFPERWQALKKLRRKEFGRYSNPMLMLELWDAWSRQYPRDSKEVEKRVKAALLRS